jgi:hypothetical protein
MTTITYAHGGRAQEKDDEHSYFSFFAVRGVLILMGATLAFSSIFRLFLSISLATTIVIVIVVGELADTISNSSRFLFCVGCSWLHLRAALAFSSIIRLLCVSVGCDDD